MTTINHTSPSGEELKPCPFCGAAPKLIVGFSPLDHAFVDCECGMQTELKDTAEEVVAMWNSRAAASNQPIGEDAANGAIGERPIDEEDAFQDWWKTRKGKNTNAYHGWMARAALAAEKVAAEPFQSRVQPWMLECFGAEIAADKIERNHRFFEEATEAVQANGMTRSEAHQLVDYTFDRPVGDLHQEIGGVMVTLAALCLAGGQDMHAAGETELARIWTKVEAIRAKQAAKPKHSPLPAAPQPAQTQVALTAAPRYREWLHLTQVGMWTAGVPTWARDHDGRMNDGIAMRSVIEELAALLAAQPVSGGKS